MTPQARRIFFQAEAQAEWFIGILRLIISTTLGIVLFVTVWFTGLPDSDMLEQQLIYAAFTMASYFTLGIVIMFLIRAGRFQAWMAWPSALIDCVFILLGSWLSLSTMGLSGQFATEAEARAGLIFLFGWPPNIVRVVMIALACIVLVAASMRIRALLRRAIDEAEARGQLTRFLPGELDGQLATRGLDAMRAGQQQRMAVMFVDIRGFTQLSETLAPPELSEFLAGYRAHVSKSTDETGGIVDKFVGDGAMVVFEDKHGDAATCAVACAQDIVARIAAWRPDLRVGVGVHIGEVFAGVVGEAGRLEYTILGDVVNVASRLEAATKPQAVSILVSDDVMAHAEVDRTDWQHHEMLSLPGRNGKISAWGFGAT